MSEGGGILRPEWQAALNDALAACREVADHHEDAARRVDETGARWLLLDLAASHRELANVLERALRREGALPAAPDADAESLRRVVKWAREALSDEVAESALEDRRRAESELAERLSEAARHELPEGARAVVERMRREVARAGARLAQAHRRIRGG